MDPSAVNWNVTIDDFDSLLTYEDPAVWTTPDPSASNYSTAGPWFRGTYHKTETKGASVSLNITGPALYIYGTKGPDYGSFEVDIDSVSLQYSAYQEAADNTTRLLFGASNLTYANHNIVLRNLGAQSAAGDKGGDAFSLDYLDSTIQVAPSGATASNVTYQETDPAITFNGTWGNNTGPFFSGGGTTFTNEDGASFSFSFHGSAIYVFGDKKNDHGIYGVVLDNQPAQLLDGVSGCGGAFGQTCEEQIPSIKYLASNLDDSLHTITLVNHAGVNNSFFDLDSIVVAVPSQYSPRQLSTSSSPFVAASSTSSSGSSTTSSGVANPSNTSAASSTPAASASFFLIFISFLYLLRPSALRRL
ncbi:hypothetical protein HYPSUDRAFT_38305 [Hypholoma sublateritium FD-334 SS-4]|uniref:Glycoside hydrolase family 16 protein n=1 Tax=Hypholoma sublateritium (strain FD-334 SS-4) TaxID=945553 RepID=A0A0D2P1V4_HYPSF|nr:hypothetical protein HYPSUDRAFT_38305 [Hypholoma sublateritium FD-334 SS-4]